MKRISSFSRFPTVVALRNALQLPNQNVSTSASSPLNHSALISSMIAGSLPCRLGCRLFFNFPGCRFPFLTPSPTDFHQALRSQFGSISVSLIPTLPPQEQTHPAQTPPAPYSPSAAAGVPPQSARIAAAPPYGAQSHHR